MNDPSSIRTVTHLDGEIVQVVTTLLMIGPSREFAAGAVAVASAMGCATPAMLKVIEGRWQNWNESPRIEAQT